MGGGGNVFGTILNIVSFAVPALRPIAIGFNMANSVINENPLGMASAAFGAYNLGGDAFGLDQMGAEASSVGLDDWTSNATGGLSSIGTEANWYDTPLAGTEESPFLGSEGLQNAVTDDPGAWGDMVQNTVQGLDQSLATPIAATNMSTGLDSLGISSSSTPMGFDTPIGPTDQVSDILGEVPNTLPGNEPTTLEGMNNRWDSGMKMEGISPQKYTYENKDFLTGKTGTGFNLPGNLNPLTPNQFTPTPTQFTQGLEMNNLPDIFKRLTTPIGNGGGVQAMSPLTMGLKGFGALDSLFQGKRAQDMMERQFSAANNWTDPNRARGDEANRLWQQNFNDPHAGYNEFMTGAGREFTDQARAQAAKSGRRGAYLNSGKMQSDLASLFMKNQLQRGQALAGGFAGGQNNYAATASAAPGYASMIRNQNAPIFDVLGEVSKNRSLMDLFGGSE